MSFGDLKKRRKTLFSLQEVTTAIGKEGNAVFITRIQKQKNQNEKSTCVSHCPSRDHGLCPAQSFCKPGPGHIISVLSPGNGEHAQTLKIISLRIFK